MSNAIKDLLAAYYADVTARMVTGGALAAVHDCYIIQAPELLPPDFSAELPLALIYLSTPVNVTPHCLPMLFDRKIFSVTISLLVESVGSPMLGFIGDSYYPGVLDIARSVEELYQRETFAISDTCATTQIDFSLRVSLPFVNGSLAQAHLTFQHDLLEAVIL